MKEDLRAALNALASHPVTYGIAAAIARWYIGDREGGLKAFLGYVIASAFVALAVAAYLADESMTQARAGFWVTLAAFVARDLLYALAAIAQKFRADPINLALRIWQALRGGEPPK